MPNRLLLELSERPSFKRLLVSRSLTRRVVERFVPGESIDDGIRAANETRAWGADAILDYLGENVSTENQADDAAALYSRILDRIAVEAPSAHISVKLTQLGLDQSFDRCLERLEKLCARASEIGTTVAIDMESHEYTDRTLEVFRRLRTLSDNVVLCLQAYLRRTQEDVASLLPLDPVIRLCKGAYNEPPEISLGREETRTAYRHLVATLMRHAPKTAIATHDEHLITHVLRLSRRYRLPPDRFEFQMLYGVRREVQHILAREGFKVRVYIPFGTEWYAYLMRRLAERPANLRLFAAALLRG